eukprot:56720_1
MGNAHQSNKKHSEPISTLVQVPVVVNYKYSNESHKEEFMIPIDYKECTIQSVKQKTTTLFNKKIGAPYELGDGALMIRYQVNAVVKYIPWDPVRKLFQDENKENDEYDKSGDELLPTDKISQFTSKENINTIAIYFASHLPIYHHTVSSSITCPNLLASDNRSDPSNCEIYRCMKNLYVWSEENLRHLHQHCHFEDEYSQKPKCKYSDKCNTYQRLCNGGSRLDDRCHGYLYRHPPITEHIKLSKDIGIFQCKSGGRGIHDQWTKPKLPHGITNVSEHGSFGEITALFATVLVNFADHFVATYEFIRAWDSGNVPKQFIQKNQRYVC